MELEILDQRLMAFELSLASLLDQALVQPGLWFTLNFRVQGGCWLWGFHRSAFGARGEGARLSALWCCKLYGFRDLGLRIRGLALTLKTLWLT